MASAKQQENMLLTEHFSWPPISLIDDIINAVNEVLYRCTDSFETGLSSADPALLGFSDRYVAENRKPEKDEDGMDLYPEARLEVEEGTLMLETLMENAVDKNFDKLEIWVLRNVFALSRGDEELVNWIKLGHYENIQPPPKDSTLTPEALYTLRRKLIETQKLNSALLAEKTRNEAQIARLRSLLQPAEASKRESTNSRQSSEGEGAKKEGGSTFSFLTHTPAAQSLGIQPIPSSNGDNKAEKNGEKSTPLTTHTIFTTSQLPYLRQLLASLKPHLATTSLPTNTSPSSHSDATAHREELGRERKVYVESQSKRILERRGVDTKDGVEGVWEGSRVRGEEVRGLEGLVEGMGRGKGDVRGDDAGAGAEEKDEDAMDTS